MATAVTALASSGDVPIPWYSPDTYEELQSGRHQQGPLWWQPEPLAEGLWYTALLEADMIRIGTYSSESNQGAIAAVDVEALLNWTAFRQIVISRVAEVRDYLFTHPDLLDLLARVCQLALYKAGNDTELSLEVYRDPEIQDEYLTLYARRDDYDADFIMILEGIRSAYQEELSGRSGWILVTTDFGVPRVTG